ncbi:MAG: hypothetical protein ACRDJW_13835 [Thermomicrobiales bacterium]
MVALPDDRPDPGPDTPPRRYRINIPPPERATPEELARRRANHERVVALREKIGPIGISTDELIHEARCEANDFDD